MRKILEELWYGNICCDNVWQNTSKEVKELMKCTVEKHESLRESLTDSQKELLEQFDDGDAKLNDMNEREIFTYAFRLGARIAIEVMSFNIK